MKLTPLPGGVTAAPGFRAAGIAAGLKASGRPDLALVVSDLPAAAAATLTTNRVRAAPCVLTERHVADGLAQAVVLNSGNANACTGPRGLADAEATASAVAVDLGLEPTDVLVCSTGIIGVPLPMEPLLAGIPLAVKDLGEDGGPRAAQAIATTDSRPKESAYRVEDGSGTCVVGGMAKGAGMIEPAMATMLAVITTDAPVDPDRLRDITKQAVARTFNRISVDACGSTNDTVIVLAAGKAPKPPEIDVVRAGIEAVCADLARAIVADGEGTTKVCDIEITGARTEEDAVDLARAVSRSVLFRAALHGADPNWGRILAAMGTADVDFDPARVDIDVAAAGGGVAVPLCRSGVAATFDRAEAAAAMAASEVVFTVSLGLGDAAATLVTADLSPEYVANNAYYTS